MSRLDFVAENVEVSPEQQQVILHTLRSVLDSSHFSKSKRYPAFLEFAVRSALDESCIKLKERDVGARVFGRPLDYETASDPVVRIAAGEVRRRTAAYFSEHPEAPVRIDLPIGGYKAEFHFRQSPAQEPLFEQSLPEQPVAPLPEVAAQEAKSSAPAAVYMFTDVADSVHAPRTSLLRRKAAWWAGLAALLILAGASVGVWRHLHAQLRSEFWQPVLQGHQTAQILVGKTKLPNEALTAISQQEIALYGPSGPPSLALDDAIVAAQICSTFREYGHACKVLPGQEEKIEDIRKKSVVVIGGFNNPWTGLLLAPLPYAFQYDQGSKTRSVIEHKPTGNSPLGTVGYEAAALGKDYAIVARFHSDITNSMVVVIAGLGLPGTRVAGQYVDSPESLNEILTLAPKGWHGVNFEAVMQIDVVHGSAGSVQVIASQFW